jgi:altronate hydrolase
MQNLDYYAIVVDEKKDNVAIARDMIPSGTEMSHNEKVIVVSGEVCRGHRFAIKPISKGGLVLQYGEPFGAVKLSRRAGDPVGIEEVSNKIPKRHTRISVNHTFPEPDYFDEIQSFNGYIRKDGRVGTRNYFLIIPLSFCANQIVSDIAGHFSRKIKGMDGVVALDRNNTGCGGSKKDIEIAKKVYANYARHPNVGGVLFVENGCEKACIQTFRGSCGEEYCQGFRGLGDPFEDYKPTEWLSLQDENCNFARTVRKGIRLVEKNLETVASAKRVQVPLSQLVFGVECGGSDAFSGLSGNRALGEISDYIVRSRGTVIISEVPEFCGAEHLLAKRGKNKRVAEKVLQAVEWYRQLAERNNASLEDNPSAGNRREGLINIAIKSLGAIRKGGTTRVEEVIDYGEITRLTGLNVMQGPGGDLMSVTGLVASGATVVGFSTGCGTPTGNPIVPVVRVVNTNARNQGADIFDYNCGPLISRTDRKSIEQVREGLLEKVIRVANGERTRAEIHRCKDFLVWPGDGIST